MARGRQDVGAFRRFAEEASPGLLRLAFLLLGDRALAEDALQATLLRTYQHWRKASANPPAYGRTVLVNLCRDHWRSGRRAHEFPAQPSSLDRVAQADAANAIIDRVAMEQALRVLSQQQRQVLVLRYFSDLSLADTAELLNLAEGTVKSTASRALAKLREELLAQQRKEAPVAD